MFSFPCTIWILLSPLLRSHQNAVASSGMPSMTETGIFWRQSSEAVQRWWRDWSTSHMRKSWETWDNSAWRRECFGEGFINVWKYMTGGCRHCEAGLFSVIARSNGTKWNTGGFFWVPGNTFLLWRWPRTGTGWAGMLWNLHLPWYSKAVWTQSWPTDPAWAEMLDQMFLPSWIILL